MAARYVYSGAAGTGTGASWANAHTTLTAAIAAATAGDDYYVAHDHAETSGSAINLAFKGTASAFDHFYCVDRAGTVPPVAADLRTTATVTTTAGANLTVGRNTNGFAYVYGIKFISSGTVLDVGAGSAQTYESCNFNLTNVSGAQGRLGTGNSTLRFFGCTVTFASTASSFTFDGNAGIWDGAGLAMLVGGTIPNAILSTGSLDNIHGYTVRNTDFSNLGSSGFILDLRGVGSPPTKFFNCKLNSTPFGFLGGIGASNNQAQAFGCDVAGGSANRNGIWSYVCNLLTETTIIRAGGPNAGTGVFSWKLVPQNSANRRDMPFETPEASIWNSTTGATRTLTVHALTDGVTLKNDELWLEVDYLGSSSAPIASRVTSEPATRLTANADLASDAAASWVTTGLGSPTKLKFSVSFVPQMIGEIRWRLRYGHSSATVYVCPNAELT